LPEHTKQIYRGVSLRVLAYAHIGLQKVNILKNMTCFLPWTQKEKNEIYLVFIAICVCVCVCVLQPSVLKRCAITAAECLDTTQMLILSLFYCISKFYNILVWVLYFLKVLSSVYYYTILP